MSAIDSAASTSVVPPWLSPSAAADVLGRASWVLTGQSWLEEGDVHWCGWGEPSAELVASMPGRWVTSPGPLSDESTTGPAGPMTAAGVHVMVDRLAHDLPGRLDGFTRLWNLVAVDGLISLTYPVHAGPEVMSGAASRGEKILIDHRQLVEELLLATSGRLLTVDMVVHHPDSAADGMTWATLVLRRLR
ncbi:MAG: hypothetical protein OEZ14_00625 [Acidimicrobiia bacterium]|nr:hypothetical protein [Acidimicrobiia bacterium]MDH5519012.1 hypothetical protein [Acidimicrobiia bacterium]